MLHPDPDPISAFESVDFVLDVCTEDAVSNPNGGPMTPELIDAVFADDSLSLQELNDAKIISGVFASTEQARQFLLRVFNPGAPAVDQRHDVFHRLHLEDALPVEEYLG